ncbi:hypothetical protein Tco_0845564 [Tanacetum coccineum]
MARTTSFFSTPLNEHLFSRSSSPTHTPFGDSDFLLKDTDAFLAIEDEPISPEIDDSYYDSEGDIILLEEFLNDDPSSPPLPPQELKVVSYFVSSYEDIRPLFERVWDQNNAFVPKDSEIEKEVMKKPGFDFQQKSSKKRSREDSDEDNAKK